MGQPAAAPAGPSAAGAIKVKPALRGVSHHFAAVAALAAGIMLVLDAPSSRARLACAVYTATVTAMLSVSALYHVPTWSLQARKLLRRADHCTIFLQIAGTYTPICLLGCAPAVGTRLLATVWAGATAGVTQSLFFPHAPKAVGAVIYVVLGWAAVPYAAEIKASMPTAVTVLIVAGGLSYSIGVSRGRWRGWGGIGRQQPALPPQPHARRVRAAAAAPSPEFDRALTRPPQAAVYAARWPDPAPATFGYHEVFHALVVLAAALHFAAVYLVAHSPRPLNKP